MKTPYTGFRRSGIFAALAAMAVLGSNDLQAQATIASNTLTGTQFLGSNNNFDVIFRANNIERARILASNGFLGIGTTAPQARLDVANSIRFFGTG